MLSDFDWLRRSTCGAELIATIDLIESDPHLFRNRNEEMGPAMCGIDGPCTRCWVYPRLPESSGLHCAVCEAVLAKSKRLGRLSMRCMVVWGFVNFLPGPVRDNRKSGKGRVRCTYTPDENHFLTIMNGFSLREWLREILLYHGSELKGVMLLFPTIGKRQSQDMGDILCWAIHHDSRFPMDRLRIRFFSNPLQLIAPHRREDQGLLTFEASEFLGLLEMATIFRARLLPNEQDMVRETVNLKDNREKRFYWGRLMGLLSREAKDMLSAWKFQQWPKQRVRLLYELIDHVPFTP